MKRFLIIIFIFVVFIGSSFCQIKIDIVYPRPAGGKTIPVIADVDSTFILGSVDPVTDSLWVNGIPTEVMSNGAFIAFVPVDKKSLTFIVTAGSGDLQSTVIVPFEFPKPEIPVVIDSPLPVTLSIADAHSVMRYSDKGGVYYIFPALNAKCGADTIVDNFFGVKLTKNQTVWVEEKYVDLQLDKNPPNLRRVLSLRAYDYEEYVDLVAPSGNYPLHRVVEFPEYPPRLNLYLYKVESHIDKIVNDTEYIKDIRWEQIDSETLKLSVLLNDTQIWGHSAEIDDGGNFHFKISKPTSKLSFKKLRIAIDPGHGGANFGAVGPTRLTEKEINLKLALVTANLLRRKGADVILTRTEDVDVDLYQRMDLAEDWNADIFISIHNNAVPDGENPDNYEGMGVYYYRPFAADLAKCLQKNLMKKTRQNDEGLIYANLAVPRTASMISILIEAAYIINPAEEQMLTDENYRKKFAKGVYLGIKEFLKTVKENRKRCIE